MIADWEGGQSFTDRQERTMFAAWEEEDSFANREKGTSFADWEEGNSFTDWEETQVSLRGRNRLKKLKHVFVGKLGWGQPWFWIARKLLPWFTPSSSKLFWS